MDLLSGVTVFAPAGSVARVHSEAGGISVVFEELPEVSENATASNANSTTDAGVDRVIGEFEDFCSETARRVSQGYSRLLAEIEALSLDSGAGLFVQDGLETGNLEVADRGTKGGLETTESREETEKMEESNRRGVEESREKAEEMVEENTEALRPSPEGVRELWDPGPFVVYTWKSEVLDYGGLLRVLQQEGVFRRV